MTDRSNYYLQSLKKEFLRYKKLGEGTFAQLSDDEINWQNKPTDNSVSIIVKHLAGNMLSRFTAFLSEDGEKSWRNREAEFEASFRNKAEMINAWEKGWECVFQALNSLTPELMDSEIKIRNEAHTVEEAFNRQLAHYAYHLGQIVFLGKMIKGDSWTSLSIPKGGSAHFNEKMFGKQDS